MDFLIVKHRNVKDAIEVYPDFKVSRSEDLMIRGGIFYAIWDQDTGLWSTDEYDVQRLVDNELREYATNLKQKTTQNVRVRYMSDFLSTSWTSFKTFISKLSDNSAQLDNKIVFSNTEVKKKDYISKKLPYPLEDGSTDAFDTIFTTIYDQENLDKFMWAIGSIIDGASKKIQKFFVFFGNPGTGKSTSLNLIQEMFPGYYTTFEAKTLTSGFSGFSTEVFRNNPLIGINHEGDLSGIRDNSMLNSIVSHDDFVMNVKYQHSYTMRLNAALFMATNKPVNITDAKSGVIRRLIDIRPTGKTININLWDELMRQISFEYGAIAYKCLMKYRELGKNYYSHYKPIDMMLRTNVFFNFVEENYFEFSKDNRITLSRAWKLYKDFCDRSNIENKLPRYKFRDELRNYWKEFNETKRVDGVQYRSLFEGFDISHFRATSPETVVDEIEVRTTDWLEFKELPSILDVIFAEQPAQYANQFDTPYTAWDKVTTTLSQIDSTKLHYVLPKEKHVMIDFDIKDADGNKSLALNIEAARKFPKTYAELSKSGQGIHLHYVYEGDAERLSSLYDENIEVLPAVGKRSIRRLLLKNNGEEIATISSGLPLKEPKMYSETQIKSERSLRLLILRNLKKDIHPATKPSIDFMYTILTEANASGLVYDISDLKGVIMNFAANSTNNAEYCIKKVLEMPLVSENESISDAEEHLDERLVFFDVEVFPNLLLVCWKYEGTDSQVNTMFNPEPADIDRLFRLKLVGYNNRRYDNHILYARVLGFSNEQIYMLSSRIIENDRSAMIREAYGVSYLDVYDYSSNKKSLKQWQTDLGIFHDELDHPWDMELPEDDWQRAAEYCANDVISLEVVHRHLEQDFNARQILAELSGLRVNDSTLSHTAKIIFGNDRNPQDSFVYTDLSELFPGYTFKAGVSNYIGEVVGEGGYVYSEPGMYNNVVYLDIASMHPTSIELLNLFGPYTEKFSDLKKTRVFIKEKNFKEAGKMYGGLLNKYLEDPSSADNLAYALKIVVNTVYGLTAARFDNPFRDPRNIDNIVAKRGSLFMVDLKHALQKRGCKAIHFKTDSVKIADYTEEDIEYVKQFGLRYGYEFGIEGIYEKLTLTNDAVLIGKRADDGSRKAGTWDAVGAQFARPYVFKTLFSKEPIEFKDKTESRSVKVGYMYLKMDENGGEDLVFVGRVGLFCPIKEGFGGGRLLRIKDDKEYAVTGTLGYRWLPANMVDDQKRHDQIDESYFKAAVDEAVEEIGKFGDVSQFLD